RTGLRVLRHDRRGRRGGGRVGDHHRALPSPADREPSEHQSAQRLMLPLVQAALQAAAPASHPLNGTAAQWLWLVPMLPLAGFLINGALSLGSVFRAGPADPSLAHGDDHGHAHAADHADEHGAHGDDHHAVKRHRFAGVTSLVGPGVLVLAFLVTAAIYFAMRGAGGGAMEAPFV